MTRIVQISDTHLGRTKPHFAANWAPLADWIAAQQPAVVIHSGDITVDGADNVDDMVYCADLLSEMTQPVLVVPGNHDVGQPHHPHQPVNPARLAQWRAHFGADNWTYDIEQWRLVGFNSMLLGSELAEEEEQFAWLEETFASADGRRIGWFLHQPLFVYGYEDGDVGYWSVKPAPRNRLKALAERFEVGLVASGHLHRAYSHLHSGTRHVWCPSAAFAVGLALQPDFPGAQYLGAVTYEFTGRDVHVESTPLTTLTPMWIDDVVHEVYPARD